MTEWSTRRRFLGAVAATGAAALAGCGGETNEDGDGGDPTEPPSATPSATAGPTGRETGTPTPSPSPTSGASPTPTRTAPGTTTTTSDAAGAWTPTADPPASFDGYETTTVRVETSSGEWLGAVRAAVSDTADLRYTGLSDTALLPTDWGMLFVYESVGDHTYVMRRMDFAIDIVYADADGEITSIHHAPAPGPDEDGNEQEYPGRGQYVLEVNHEWTSERGVEEGDRLRFEL